MSGASARFALAPSRATGRALAAPGGSRASPRRSAPGSVVTAAAGKNAGGDAPGADAPPRPPRGGKVRRRPAVSNADAAAATEANVAAPKEPAAASPKPKKRTVRRLKNNAAVAIAAEAQRRRDAEPEEVEVSDERREKERIATERFEALAARIAAEFEAETVAAAVGADPPAEATTFAAEQAPLVPRSMLEEVDAARRAVDAAEKERPPGSPGGASKSDADPDETPGERLKRLFREKRARGLSRVRDKFENLEKFDELVARGAGVVDGGTGEDLLDPLADARDGAAMFGEAAAAAAANSSLLAGGGNGLSPNNSIDPFKLIPGEYVVHRKFGVGKFLGIRSIAVEAPAPNGDPPPKVGYLFIKYADAEAKIKPEKARAQLYRYASPGAIKAGTKPPKLDKIQDRKGWEAKEQNTKRHIRQLVVNQMCVYLQRLQCVRAPYAAPSDSAYERFGDLFPFELTPDQSRAIADCYEDLSDRDTPMDRIVVGDVGFGKTEVAMRAVFRVFAGGGQVFVLAPTTVLAKQHAATIAARFRPFGAGVELLSRNVKESTRQETLGRWKRGETQVIVGTHSLLNLEPEMYDRLRMLVIDEEQRFGVKHKDQISALKASVDVLTLSATPIPRTLHMAIAGFRDASLVTTPPPQRRPINTILQMYDDETVRAAVTAELERDGQIFYVVPKIQMMQDAMKRLRRLFPHLRIMEAHGQMKGEHLDVAMDAFASGDADVLLCTTIVESGLDIPNVNTIIIEEVQQFGLASLYQLRGRVGRAGRQAYAYMFHADRGDMRQEAQDRLVALEECCGLGEGFKLAERDMAIRGVGTIFGDKQSGEVDSIGADLYLELLYKQLEKVEKLRLNPIDPDAVETPGWPTKPSLGRGYVATDDARDVAVESLANSRTDAEIDKVFRGLVECFGEPDAESLATVNYYRMRALAGELGVTRVSFDREAGGVRFEINAEKEVREMLVDNLDEMYRKDLETTDEHGGGIFVKTLAGAGMNVTVAQAVTALRRINDALPSFIKFL